MGADFWFWLALGATVALMALALVSGLTRKRRAHLLAGPAAMGALLWAILLTEGLARRSEFVPEVTAVHLWCAKTAGLLALPVILTGALLVFRPSWRKRHRIAVYVFLLATVVATVTGIWMFSGAVPRPV